MSDITTRENASTALKREWFYKDKDVARPIMNYDEICVIVDMLEEQERNGKEMPTELYAKMVRAKHLIEERRIKGDKK